MYKKLLQLIKFLENENSKCKYDTNKISKRIILKDILNKLHELRQIAKQQRSFADSNKTSIKMRQTDKPSTTILLKRMK